MIPEDAYVSFFAVSCVLPGGKFQDMNAYQEFQQRDEAPRTGAVQEPQPGSKSKLECFRTVSIGVETRSGLSSQQH